MKDINTPLYYYAIAFTLWIICFQNLALAQQSKSNHKPLRGLVMDSENDDLLMGVHIYAKVAHVGSVSDQRGIFEMTVDEKDTLVVTFMGFERQIIPLVYFRDQKIDLLIMMDSEVIILDGVTIMGQPNIDYLYRSKGSPMRIPGLQPPAKKPDVDVPVGSLNYGIMSRWGKEAKEKRKLMEVYAEGQKEKIYIKTVSSDSVKQIFMNQYDLSKSDYNDFVIFFNSYKPFMDRQDPIDIVRVMHLTFLRYKPRVDMK